MYGYKQKVGEKVYHSRGVIGEFGGKKISPASFLIPIEKSNEMIKFLRTKKINYEVKEVFMD